MPAPVFQGLARNWKAGLAVSVVSIPLALALAITSGATPTQGIITAVWAGLLAAVLGSSNFNVVGPTGALAGILVSYAIVHGYQLLPIVAILSGLIILAAWLLRLDKYIIFIPRSVVHGFTLGVAFIIGLGQLNNALGITHLTLRESQLENVLATLQALDRADWMVFLLFLGCMAFIHLWNKKIKRFPGAAAAAFLAIAVMGGLRAAGFDPTPATLGDRYPDVHAALFESPLAAVKWSLFTQRDLWLLSLATAVVAILETLLSGQIANNLTGTRFNRRREVFGLAAANLGSGLMGGIPATAALARTALNIKSGADHRSSAVVNSIVVALVAVFFIEYFKLLPMFVIAAILVTVAIGMIHRRHFVHLISNEKTAFVLSLVVAALVLLVDPIIGILIGTVAALLIFVNKLSYGQTEIVLWKDGRMIEALLKHDFLRREKIESDAVIYNISGTLTYINMPAHLEAVQKIRGNQYVVISLRHAFYADADGIEYLSEIIELLKNSNDKILLAGINAEIRPIVVRQEFYHTKSVEGKIYDRTSDALTDILAQRAARQTDSAAGN